MAVVLLGVLPEQEKNFDDVQRGGSAEGRAGLRQDMAAGFPFGQYAGALAPALGAAVLA